MVALIIFLVIFIPLAGILIWLILDEAFVRVDSGQLGLVVIRGKATDKSLPPGPHFVPRFWRMAVERYPSLELSYRAGDRDAPREQEGDLERVGPALRVVLGDRADLELAYTVRFRLNPESLKMVHERFGQAGIWSAARDTSARALRAKLSEPEIGIENFFADARPALEASVAEAVTAALVEDGFELTLFSLGDLDLGRTGEVIQATVRARLELEREQVEAATRLAEVRSDAELGQYLVESVTDTALRYRELGVWRDIVSSPLGGTMMPGTQPRPFAAKPTSRQDDSTPAVDALPSDTANEP